MSITVVPEESQRAPDFQAEQETEGPEEELAQDPTTNRGSDSGTDPRSPTQRLYVPEAGDGATEVAQPTLKDGSKRIEEYVPGCDGYYSGGE